MISERTVKWAVYLLFLGCVCYALFLHFYEPGVLSGLCREDGVIESLTAVFYFTASLVFLYAGKKRGFRNVWYWCFCLLFFVIAGEEISWGQRLFQFATPETLKDINVQQEFNIHNIKVIHGSIRGLGLLVFMGACYVIPLTDKFIGPLRRFYKKVRMPVYPLWLIGFPTAGLLLMAVPRLVFHKIIFNLDEVGEILFSVGFLFFALDELRRTRKPSHNDQDDSPVRY